MASRTYREEEVGPQSTNRFVVPRTFPTKVVTGATTQAASVQPNLTGKRKVVDRQEDGGESVMPDPVNMAALSEKELANMATIGMPSMTGAVVSGVGASLLGPIGTVFSAGVTAANITQGRAEIQHRMSRDEDFAFLDPPSADRERAAIKAEREKALDWNPLRDAKEAVQKMMTSGDYDQGTQQDVESMDFGSGSEQDKGSIP